MLESIPHQRIRNVDVERHESAPMRLVRPQIRIAAVLSVLTVLLLLAPGLTPGAEEPDVKARAQAYQPEIRLLVKRYCRECHSDQKTEGDIDLAVFATWDDVRKQPETWQKVGGMLESGQMPPKKAPQPTEAERTRLHQWVRGYLTIEARARAGDPGKVVLRRLSNAEYTYTLRDLTGVAALDPAREFPVDGAAGEGFTNTGNALVMSPALVTKYLDAAKEIADHAVLLPDGFRFTPHKTPRDWTEETLARIRDFYREFTDSGGGDKVNLQGIVFDTNQGGRLPLEKYLAASIAEREALASGRKNIETVAHELGLNARYLGTLWKSLTGPETSFLLEGLRPLARYEAGECRRAGGWHRCLAEGTLEIHNGRPYWKTRRTEGLAGAGDSPGRETRGAVQGPLLTRWQGGHDFDGRHRCRGRKRS